MQVHTPTARLLWWEKVESAFEAATHAWVDHSHMPGESFGAPVDHRNHSATNRQAETCNIGSEERAVDHKLALVVSERIPEIRLPFACWCALEFDKGAHHPIQPSTRLRPKRLWLSEE